jgi:hypothetical protein
MPSVLASLYECVIDGVGALTSSDRWPTAPTDWRSAALRIERARPVIPPLYRSLVVEPLRPHLWTAGASAGEDAHLLPIVASGVLQRAEGFLPEQTWALQEVVSDLYDGFLSVEDRQGIKTPDHDVPAPIVHWGSNEGGPRAVTSEMLDPLGIKAGVVTLPVGSARAGLIMWAALSHEACGHDVIGGDEGLVEEMQRAVAAELWSHGFGSRAHYWSSRVHEVVSDVVGVLNLGPTAVLSTIALLRAMEWRATGVPTLGMRTQGGHPAALLRGWLGAAVVEGLRFKDARQWAAVLRNEVQADGVGVPDIELEIGAATLVGQVLAYHPRVGLAGHPLADIQNWYDDDDARAQDLARRLRLGEWTTSGLDDATYATHVVAGALLAAAQWGWPRRVQHGMQQVLVQMHVANPSWNQQATVHPGDRVQR